MKIPNLSIENFDKIIDYMICENDEKNLLETIKDFKFSDEQINTIITNAAFLGNMEVLNYYLDNITFTKDNVCGVLVELLDSDTYSTENFIKILEKVDSSCIDILFESHYTDSTILEQICSKDDFEKILEVLYKKSESCFTAEVFDKIINTIQYSSKEIIHIIMLTELLRNEYFKKISDKSRDQLISSIFFFIQCQSAYYDADFLTSESCNLFVQYLKSKDLCIEYFNITQQICETDLMVIEDNIEEYSEETLINFFEKTNFEFINTDSEEYFLYAVAANGYTKLIDKLKTTVSDDMLNEMLYYSLSRKHFKTAAYLLKEFGTNNFEITKDILETIKTSNLSKVLLVLLKNKNNISNIDWKEWFKDLNEFSDIIETYCNNVIFSEMPYDYQILLMEFMEERKQYTSITLSEKCGKFKEFANNYGYDF